MDLNFEQLKFIRLDDNNEKDLINFSCYNDNETFTEEFRSKQIRKFKQHTKDIDTFIKREALNEQNNSLNTTWLLYYNNTIVGVLSLCSDNLILSYEEKQNIQVPYTNIPSLKIARLAIHKDYQGFGLGQLMINFAVNCVLLVRETIGVKLLTLDCYKHRVSYYKKFGFVENIGQNENRQPDNPKSFRLNVDKYLEDLNV